MRVELRVEAVGVPLAVERNSQFLGKLVNQGSKVIVVDGTDNGPAPAALDQVVLVLGEPAGVVFSKLE